MDAQQALADLAEISSQIREAVVFDEKGKVMGSTGADERARALAEGAAHLLAEAETMGLPDGGGVAQLEAATKQGSVFLVADGKNRIAATTPPNPTVGLVFYDLKSALRSIKPVPKKRAPAAKKPAPAAKRAPAKKSAPRRKKPDAS
jgi:predicted regulator of Ras-like GTPase activity (Roadblock/LC7/MglB family)